MLPAKNVTDPREARETTLSSSLGATAVSYWEKLRSWKGKASLLASGRELGTQMLGRSLDGWSSQSLR